VTAGLRRLVAPGIALLVASAVPAPGAAAETTLVMGGADGSRLVRVVADTAAILLRDATGRVLDRRPLRATGAAAAARCPVAPRLVLARHDADGDGVLEAADGDDASVYVVTQDTDGRHLHRFDITAPATLRPIWDRRIGDAWEDARRPLADPVLAQLPGSRDPRRRVIVLGRDGPGLEIRDGADGALLRSLGADATATDRIAGLDTSFAGSFAAIDLDGDGLSDRLYAGDVAGNLWRIGLPATADGTFLARVWGRFGITGGGRGFVAPPDLARLRPRAGLPFLSVVAGTTTLAAAGPDVGASPPGGSGIPNMLYLLRDSLAADGARWPADQPALTDAMIPLADPGTAPLRDLAAQGYRIALGTGRSLARTTTANGTLLFLTAQDPADDGGCAPAVPPVIVVRATALRIEDATVALDLDGDGSIGRADVSVPLPRPVPGDSRIVVTQSTAPDGSARMRCSVAGQDLAACVAPPVLRLTDWRREDAE
jgi:hypothetical protein